MNEARLNTNNRDKNKYFSKNDLFNQMKTGKGKNMSE